MPRRLLTAAFVLVPLAVTAAPAADPPKSAASANEPTVTARGCRVTLDREALLAADRVGILDAIPPGEGDRVEAGQLVAKLKDEVAAAALAVAEETARADIEIRYAQKAADVAVIEYRKAQQANRETPGVITEVEAERLKLSAERAKLQTEKAVIDKRVAELERDKAAAELKTYRVVAPFDGVVTQVIKHEGEAVNQGDPILRIVNVDRVRVEGFVSIADAARVRPGDAVIVRLDLSSLAPELRNRRFEGRVEFVDVVATLIKNEVRVWASVPNEDGLLRAGLTAEMEISPGTGNK